MIQSAQDSSVLCVCVCVCVCVEGGGGTKAGWEFLYIWIIFHSDIVTFKWLILIRKEQTILQVHIIFFFFITPLFNFFLFKQIFLFHVHLLHMTEYKCPLHIILLIISEHIENNSIWYTIENDSFILSGLYNNILLISYLIQNILENLHTSICCTNQIVSWSIHNVN